MAVTESLASSSVPDTRPSKVPAALAPLLSVSGPFWRGRNLRRLLSVLIPFALACILTYKTMSGQWLNFYPSSYAPWSLGSSLLFPLNIFQTPGEVLVVGLLLSLLVVLPILAGQLFGIAPAVCFLACIFGLAHLPMLALFQVIGLVLAAAPPLIRRSRFYPALLAVAPLALYLFLEVQIVLAWARYTVITPSPVDLSVFVQQATHPTFPVGAIEVLVSPSAVCLVLAVCIVLAFIGGIPSVLSRSRYFSLVLVSAIVSAYLACSVFMFLQPGRYHDAGPVNSVAELVWPEISHAGQASRQALINLTPIQQTWLYSPSMLAVCLVLIVLPVLLFLDRRSKAAPKILALTSLANVAICLLLFYSLVGAETLDFNVLKARLETGSALLSRFPSLPEYQRRLQEYQLASDPVARLKLVQQRTELMNLLNHTVQSYRKAELQRQIRTLDRRLRYVRDPGQASILLRLKERVFHRLVAEFEERVAVAKRTCQVFLKKYPDSRYKPYVLHIEALVMDARLDMELLKKQGIVEVYYHFPSPESRTIRQQLLREFPRHVLACPNGLALAQLLGREGNFESALAILQEARKAGQNFFSNPSSPRPGGTIMDKLGLPPDEPVGPEQISAMLRENRRLSELITANYRDPLYGFIPLRRLLTRDPQQPDYIEQISEILDAFPGSLVADNIQLRIILAQPPAYRLHFLRSALREFAVSDIAKDVLFYLAELEMTLATSDPPTASLRSQAVKHLREFLDKYPDSYQAPLAQEYLARLVSLNLPAE